MTFADCKNAWRIKTGTAGAELHLRDRLHAQAACFAELHAAGYRLRRIIPDAGAALVEREAIDGDDPADERPPRLDDSSRDDESYLTMDAVARPKVDVDIAHKRQRQQPSTPIDTAAHYLGMSRARALSLRAMTADSSLFRQMRRMLPAPFGSPSTLQRSKGATTGINGGGATGWQNRIVTGMHALNRLGMPKPSALPRFFRVHRG